MGLFDKLIDAAIDEVIGKPIRKAQAEKFRRKWKGKGDAVFDEIIEEVIAENFGDEAAKKRRSEYYAEQDRKNEEHRQYLIDRRACSTCRYYGLHVCTNDLNKTKCYSPNGGYFTGYAVKEIKDPDRTTCSYYKQT